MEKDGQQKEFVSPREFFIERGEWQKEYVCKLVEQGVSYGHAMIAMGLTCEERLKSYMQGYERGYNDRDTQTRNKPQHSGVPNMTTKEKLDAAEKTYYEKASLLDLASAKLPEYVTMKNAAEERSDGTVSSRPSSRARPVSSIRPRSTRSSAPNSRRAISE